MVCLLAGADVVSGGRCVVLCVVALSKRLVKNVVLSKHCESFYKVRGVPVWGLIYIPGFCIFVTAVYCH